VSSGNSRLNFFSRLIAPLLFDTTLQSTNLVVALTRILTGLKIPSAVGFILHTVIGVSFVLIVWTLHKAFSLRLVWAGAMGGFDRVVCSTRYLGTDCGPQLYDGFPNLHPILIRIPRRNDIAHGFDPTIPVEQQTPNHGRISV